MSKNQGTLVTAPIRPNDADDPIATGFANEIAGGHHHYPALTDKASIAIIRARRRWGMLCTIADGTYKLLKPDPQDVPEPDIMDNAYWVKVLGNEYTDREILNLGQAGSFGLYVGKNQDGNHELRSLRLAGGITAEVNPAGELVLTAPELSISATNLGDGAQVYRDTLNDTLRFRSLVAGTGVTITEDANFILISADGGGSGQGSAETLLQSDIVSLGHLGETTLTAKSIHAVYELTLPIFEYEARTETVSYISSQQAAFRATINSACNNISTSGFNIASIIASDGNNMASPNTFTTIFIGATTCAWLGTTRINSLNTEYNGAIFANVQSAATVNRPTKVIFKLHTSSINININPVTAQAVRNLSGETCEFDPDRNSNDLQIFQFPNTINAQYIAVYYEYEGSSFSNNTAFIARPVYITAFEQGGQWEKMNEHEDYTVIRSSSTGSQTHTIRRLKEGVTDHIIEYFEESQTSSITAENIGTTGEGVFFQKDGQSLQFKKLVAGAGIDIQDNGQTLEIINTGGAGGGEANTASNLGAGQGVYSTKVGADLRFKSLVAGSNVSLSSDSTTITLAVPTVGEVNTASNLGAGTGIYALKSGTDLRFKSLVAGTNISLTQDANTITISASGGGSGEANTASNLGTGTGVFASKSGIDLRFRSILAGSGIGVSLSGSDIIITNTAGGGAGEANTASNLGAGNGVFASKVGTDLQFKSLVAGSNVSLSNTSTAITISVPSVGESNTGTSLGTGTAIYRDKLGTSLRFRSLLPGSGIGISLSGDNVVITNTAGGGAGEANTASNLGSGAGIYASKSGVDLRFKSLVSGQGISVSSDANAITLSLSSGTWDDIDKGYTAWVWGAHFNAGYVTSASNLGTGTGVFASKSVADLRFKSLIAGQGISVSSDANSITFAYSGPVTSQGPTTGIQTAYLVGSNTVFLKGITAGFGITLTDSTLNIGGVDHKQIVIENALDNEAVSGNTLLNKSSTNGQAHLLKRLVAGSNVTITDNGTSLSISASSGGQNNTGSNVGGTALFPFDGVEVYKGMNGTALEFRTIFGRNGITVTQGTNHILIEGTPPTISIPGSNAQILLNKNGALGVASGFKYEDFSSTLHVLSLAPSGVDSAAFIENYGHANSSLILAAPNLVLGSIDDKLSFYNGTPQAKLSITGSRGGNTALTNLLTALSSLGLITNSTSA